jgi:Ca2+-binding RTX toxin-like protein
VTVSDGSPPRTTIDSGPSGTVEPSDATFEFSSSESNSTFKCRILKNGATYWDWYTCTPGSFGSFDEGSYTFEVKASDATGSTDPTPASQTWKVAVPPTVSRVSPADQATRIDLTANVEATFSEDLDSSSISGETFTLTKQGDTAVPPTKVTATVSYDSATKKATLNPQSDLEANTTYVATPTTRVKDTAGNTLEQPFIWALTTPICTKKGTSGNDTLNGTSGKDVICGLGGNDTLQGLGGDDILVGGDGTDTLIGGTGNDTLDGGVGTDTGSYSPSQTAVNASLATKSATGEGSDTFMSIENLTGSSYADTLTGDGEANTLRGGAGNDTIVGSGGVDIHFGEDGNDTVNSKDGVNGNDSLDGGRGTDTKVTDTTEKSITGFP